jgi:hypothetical protein
LKYLVRLQCHRSLHHLHHRSHRRHQPHDGGVLAGQGVLHLDASAEIQNQDSPFVPRGGVSVAELALLETSIAAETEAHPVDVYQTRIAHTFFSQGRSDYGHIGGPVEVVEADLVGGYAQGSLTAMAVPGHRVSGNVHT